MQRSARPTETRPLDDFAAWVHRRVATHAAQREDHQTLGAPRRVVDTAAHGDPRAIAPQVDADAVIGPDHFDVSPADVAHVRSTAAVTIEPRIATVAIGTRRPILIASEFALPTLSALLTIDPKRIAGHRLASSAIHYDDEHLAAARATIVPADQTAAAAIRFDAVMPPRRRVIDDRSRSASPRVAAGTAETLPQAIVSIAREAL